MDELKKINKNEKVRVVTANELITSEDLTGLSLNARKLFYIAVAQCRKEDSEFYEYETTPTELSEMWGIDRSNIYREARKITDELMKILIHKEHGKSFETCHVFDTCKYDDESILKFKLHKEMTNLLLGLTRDFSKPLVWDFMKMRSPYSMAIWHLMQKEMHSFKPMMSAPIVFDITLEELRKVTGTEDKFKSLSEFKRFVLDKALKEIKKNCYVDISYENLKHSRTVVGFRFTAENMMGTIKLEEMPYRLQKKARRAQLTNKKANGMITPEELKELNDLNLELQQITIEDVTNNYPMD